MAKRKEDKDTRNDAISTIAQFFLKPFKLLGKAIEELFHAVSTLIYKIAYGKDFEKVVLQKEAMKEALEAAKERQKEEQIKEKAKELTPFEKIKQRLIPNNRITKEQAIEVCKEKLSNQSLNEIFNDKEKVSIFKENFDNYLDETFLKNQTKEYDLEIDKNNNILIYKMNKDTKDNRELVLGINKNEIFCKYNENLTKDDLNIYKAMLNFCKETNIKPEPTADEIKETLETEIEKIKKVNSKVINIRGTKFSITKDVDNNISINYLIEHNGASYYECTNLVDKVPLNEINYAALASECKTFINKKIVKQIENFTSIEKEQQNKEFFNNMTLKQSVDYIKEKYDLDTMDINIFENKIVIYREQDALHKKAFLSTDLNGIPHQSNEYFKELKDIQKDLSYIQDKFKNASLKDVFENTKEENGCVVINEQIYSFKQIPNSALYELSNANGEKVMTYNLRTNDLEHHVQQEKSEPAREKDKER